MSDKYGYIGIENLLNFCSNQKDHCITPNDFMRMNRVKIDERPHGEWKCFEDPDYSGGGYTLCTACNYRFSFGAYRILEHDGFCPHCGAVIKNRKG